MSEAALSALLLAATPIAHEHELYLNVRKNAEGYVAICRVYVGDQQKPTYRTKVYQATGFSPGEAMALALQGLLG